MFEIHTLEVLTVGMNTSNKVELNSTDAKL
jgi:hypothetical protein